MQFRIITLKCTYELCLKEYQGRTYQKYCSKKCQDAQSYLRAKENRKLHRKEVKCDNCGEIFLTKRQNAKRCSEACREEYRKNYGIVRRKQFEEKQKKRLPELTCNVCDKKFRSTHFRKTCSKACASDNQKYEYRKKERARTKDSGNKYWENINYVQKVWPLTTSPPIQVSNFSWPPNREDTSKAVSEFIKAGGKIQHLKDDVETNLLKDNSWVSIENLKEEAEEQLFNRVKVY